MSRRIDIELTSDRGDGTWSWRAAGAKQPKGVVPASLLPSESSVGEQLRADVETTLDGTEVLSVAPPKAKNRASVETIELLPRGTDEPLVTQTLARRGGSRDRGGRPDRPERGDRRDRGPRRDREGAPTGGGGEGRRRERSGRSREDGDGPAGGRSRRTRPERPAPPAKPKAKRLRPGRTHRKAAVDALGPDEQILADVLLQGGLPAVRQAVAKQNAQVREHGGQAVSATPLLAIAERLYPRLRVAEWRDRAEAAIADLDVLDLRDLRSVVVAADSGAKDEETRALAGQLRDGLARRQDEEQAAWLAELADTVREGRVVRALRLSSRPPKAGSPLPADLATALAAAAASALTADTLADRWATVLDALSLSPVRLNVAPASKPENPSAELIATVTRMAERVPKVAEAFGIDPSAAPRRSRAGRRPTKPSAGRQSSKPGRTSRPRQDTSLAAPEVNPPAEAAEHEPAPEAPHQPAPPDTSLAAPEANPSTAGPDDEASLDQPAN